MQSAPAAIIGYGRFGEQAAGLVAAGGFETYVVEPNELRLQRAQAAGHTALQMSDIGEMEAVFIAVPPSAFEATVNSMAEHITRGQIITDTCSVKTHPAQVMREQLPSGQLIATHPMFGPGTAHLGVADQQVVICPVRTDSRSLETIKGFWSDRGCKVIDMTPLRHDYEAVYAQGLTFTIGQLVREISDPSVSLRTRNYEALAGVAERTGANKGLYHDLMFYNPYLRHLVTEFARGGLRQPELDAILQEQEASGLFEGMDLNIPPADGYANDSSSVLNLFH
jgi:prephenate dehydrogenase